MFQKDVIRTLIVTLLVCEGPVLALTFAVLRGWRGRGREGRAWDFVKVWYLRVAERPVASIIVSGLVGLVLAVCVSAAHWPVPRVQDEFSYLLAADTFAHGRAANPPSPEWRHFESEHVLQQPMYASKYPPGQGLILAAGQVLTGEPIVGVWLSAALAGAAVCWMLQAWVPARWALLGGLLAASHPAMLAWWADGYWGGHVAMIGGALVFGGLRRIVGSELRPGLRAVDAVWVGVGLLMLAVTRPYEGLGASVPAGVVLAWWMVGGRAPFRSVVLRVVAPLGVVLALGIVGLGWYNREVAGDALVMPYRLHAAQYGATPLFLWQEAPPQREYSDRKLQDFYAGWEQDAFRRQTTALNIAKKGMQKIGMYWGFYFGPALSVALVGLFLRGRDGALVPRNFRADRWGSFAAATVGACLGGAVLTVWMNPHYIAPVGAMLLYLAVEGLRRLAHGGFGARIAWAVIASRVPMLVMALAAVAIMYPTDDWSHARVGMIEELHQKGGKHLVLLRHGRTFQPHEEWVYNGADLEGAPVVWARELSTRSVGSLLEHYADRTAWLVNAYRSAPRGLEFIPRLVPYPRGPEWMYAEARQVGGRVTVVGAACADLARNGRLDLALIEEGRRAVVLQWADGKGGYTESALDLPTVPGAVLVVDVDGDGLPDVVVGAGRQVLVLRNEGGGKFGPPSAWDAGGTIVGMVSADFDGDGRVDIAASTSDPAGVTVLINGGNGSFGAGPVLAAGSRPCALVSADLNGDGRPDLAVADAAMSAVYVFINSGGGRAGGVPGFARANEVPVGAGPVAVAAADLDGDGALDLVTANSGDDTVSVLLNRGAAGFARGDFEVGVFPVSIAAADFDGDGKPDLLIATRVGNGLTFLKNSGDGVFGGPADITLGRSTWYEDKARWVVAPDVNGDGAPDVVVCGAQGCQVILSPGKSAK